MLHSTHIPVKVQKLNASIVTIYLALKPLTGQSLGLNKHAQVLLIIPNSTLFLSNCSLLSALVKMSAICLLVAQKFIEITPFQHCLLKNDDECQYVLFFCVDMDFWQC